MYSPKISEELISDLYLIRKKEGIPMTKLVNQVMRNFIENYRKTNPKEVGKIE